MLVIYIYTYIHTIDGYIQQMDLQIDRGESVNIFPVWWERYCYSVYQQLLCVHFFSSLFSFTACPSVFLAPSLPLSSTCTHLSDISPPFASKQKMVSSSAKISDNRMCVCVLFLCNARAFPSPQIYHWLLHSVPFILCVCVCLMVLSLSVFPPLYTQAVNLEIKGFK